MPLRLKLYCVDFKQNTNLTSSVRGGIVVLDDNNCFPLPMSLHTSLRSSAVPPQTGFHFYLDLQQIKLKTPTIPSLS